jgi:hypothetical protein
MATATKKVTARFPSAVKNILNILSFATAQEIEEGKVWYKEAQAFAKQQAETYGVSLEIVAGIISALSPGVDWERNKAETLVVLNGDRSHKFGTYGPNVKKAFEIRNAGLHVNVATFFPANKTYNFYHNIINPADTNFVTIDRHALSVALGAVRADKSITNVEYRELATAYNKAAKKANLLPCEIQAITWVKWRTAKGYKAKFTIADLAARQTQN